MSKECQNGKFKPDIITMPYMQQRVKFHNTGPAGILGVIAMSIEDGDEAQNNLQQIDPL
jgi:hypothetical protein